MTPYKLHIACLALNSVVAATAFAEPYGGPPLELLAANIQNTPYTAYVRIESVQVARETIGQTTGRVALITFLVQASVAETIKGAPHARIEYLETHEAPSEGPRPGARLVVSLEEGGDGVLFVPDNGYVFPATPKVLRQARAAGATQH